MHLRGNKGRFEPLTVDRRIKAQREALVFPPGIKVKIWIKSKQKRRETNDVAVRMLLENTFSHPKCAPVPFVAVSLTIREVFF